MLPDSKPRLPATAALGLDLIADAFQEVRDEIGIAQGERLADLIYVYLTAEIQRRRGKVAA